MLNADQVPAITGGVRGQGDADGALIAVLVRARIDAVNADVPTEADQFSTLAGTTGNTTLDRWFESL